MRNSSRISSSPFGTSAMTGSTGSIKGSSSDSSICVLFGSVIGDVYSLFSSVL